MLPYGSIKYAWEGVGEMGQRRGDSQAPYSKEDAIGHSCVTMLPS